MGRRNDGLLEALVVVAARLPWWVGVGLAVVSYWVCQRYASQPLATTTDVTQLGQVGLRMVGRTLAQFGQVLLPLAFLVGAAVSWYRRRRGQALHAAAGEQDDALQGMSWGEFESLVGEYFRQRGFSAVENDRAGPDGGVDLRLRKGADRYLVQCKHWRARKVGVEPVRELYGLIAAQRAAGGFVVTSGQFTVEARRFAEGREVELISGDLLKAAIREQRSLGVPRRPLPPAGRRSAAGRTQASRRRMRVHLARVRPVRRRVRSAAQRWCCARRLAARMRAVHSGDAALSHAARALGPLERPFKLKPSARVQVHVVRRASFSSAAALAAALDLGGGGRIAVGVVGRQGRPVRAHVRAARLCCGRAGGSAARG